MADIYISKMADGFIVFQKIDAKPLKIKGIPFKLFYHPADNLVGVTITEYSTGFSMAFGETLASAKKLLKKRVESYGIESINKTITKLLKKKGMPANK